MRKAALVTGGAARIGRRIAERLAGEGFAVAIHCHNSGDQAERLRKEIIHHGGQAAVVEADLNDRIAVSALIQVSRERVGPLSLLVNNASEFIPDEIDTLVDETWDRHLEVNLRAPLFIAKDFARQVPDGLDASIVNIVDQRVLKPTPLFFSYALSKAALFDATKTLAQALAPKVRVNAVAPGPTLAGVRQSKDDFAQQARRVLMRRAVSPDEIADAVLFLASARSVTGQTIAVDGGQHLAWETPDIAGITE